MSLNLTCPMKLISVAELITVKLTTEVAVLGRHTYQFRASYFFPGRKMNSFIPYKIWLIE